MSDNRDMARRAVLGVIPARYGASRFPGKPLAMLWGKPMIQHVWDRARRVHGLDELVIATDDDRIEEVAQAFGAKVERTSSACATGTDRVAEVARRKPGVTHVLNIQGDEPELDPGAVERLVKGMRLDATIRMGTLAHGEDNTVLLATPDVVKVVVDAQGNAIYFSRADIANGSRGGPVLRHVGIYGFTRDFLLEFASWPQTDLERAERLEQLRALEHGIRIRVYRADHGWSGVDTPEELAALEKRGPRS